MNAEGRYRNQLLIARILAGRYEMELVVNAHISTAMTNGKTLFYPAAWMMTDSEEMAAVMDGIIDHEAAGHGRHTDFTVPQSDRPLVRRLANIFEDVWCELAAGVRWPGIPANLSRTVTVLTRWGLFGDPASAASAELPPGALLCNALLVNCRARFLPGQGEALGDLAMVTWRMAQRTFGPLWPEVWKLACRAPDLRSTREATDLASAVFELLQLQGVPDKPESTGNGQSGKDGADPSGNEGSDAPKAPGTPANDAGKGDSAGEGDSTAQSPAKPPETPGKDEGEAANPAAPAGKESGAGEPSGHGEGAGSPTPGQRAAARNACDAPDNALPKTDLGELTGQAMSAKLKPLPKLGPIVAPVAIAPAEPVPKSWQLLGARVRNTLAAELETYLEARVTRHTKRGYSGRRLDSGRLCRLRLGDARVFRTRSEEEGIDTAASVLIDLSPSMQEVLGTIERVMPAVASGSTVATAADTHSGVTYDVKRNQAAGSTAAALAPVLELFEVPFEVIGYSTGYHIIKSFEDRWDEVCRRGQAVTLKGKATATGMAMTVALSRLMLREENRRILVVVTDGAAGDSGVTESAYRFAKEAGIDVATVFVGHDVRGIALTRQILSKTGFAKDFALVNSPQELAKGVIDAMRSSF